MALDESDIETRTLALERKVNRLRAVLDDMVIFRVPRLEQQLAMLWSLPPRRVAQITGQVDGCASQGFPGATIRVLNASGERLGTGKCDSSGHYTALANLESDPQTVTLEATPVGTYAARFNGPATGSMAANVGDNSASTITIPPAASWCCGAVDYFPGECCVGKGNTLRFTLNGCSRPIAGACPVAGASVDFVLSGVIVHSGTTNSLGRVDYFEPYPGTYTINWAIPGTGFSGSASAVIATNCTPSLVQAVANVATPAGYQCCPTVQQNARALPFPVFAGLFITDDAGTRAFGECVVYNGYVLKTAIVCNTTCSNAFSLTTVYTPVPAPPADPCTYLDSTLPACPVDPGPGSSSAATVTTPASSEAPFEIAGTWGAGGCGFYAGSFPLDGSSFLVHT